jgi:pyruvate dehydrogenase E1 component alpha subunit
MLRLQKYLRGKGLWSEEQEEKFKAEAGAIVSQAVEEAEAVPPPKIEDMFQYTFAELTPNLKEQMEDYLAFERAKEK